MNTQIQNIIASLTTWADGSASNRRDTHTEFRNARRTIGADILELIGATLDGLGVEETIFTAMDVADGLVTDDVTEKVVTEVRGLLSAGLQPLF
jgi:hypothetical protein